VVSAVLSYFVSVNSYLSFWGDSQLPADSLLATILFFLFAFLVLQTFTSERRFKILTHVFTAIIIAQVLCCLAEIYNLNLSWWVLHLAVFGTQGQTVACASLIRCLTPFLVVSFFNSTNNNLKNIFYGLLLFSVNFCMLYTSARTPIVVSWATSLVISIFYIFHNSRFHSLKKVILLLSLLVGSSFLFKYSNSNSELEAKTGTTLVKKGYVTRKLLLESGIKAWKEKPVLGYGPYAFEIAQRPYQTAEMNIYDAWEFAWLKAHNHLVDTLVNQGALGLISALLLYFYLLSMALKLFFKKNHSELELLALASFAGYNFLFISNLTAFNMIPTQMLYTVFPVLFSLGSASTKVKTFTLKPAIRIAAFLTSLIVLCNILAFTYKAWRADIFIQLWSKNPAIKEDRIKSLELTNLAITYNPSEPIYYCFASQLYSEMLARNYKSLKENDKLKTLDTIDENLNECISRGQGIDYLIRLSGELYGELFFQGVINPDKALSFYDRMKVITPFNPFPILEIGRIKLRMGNADEFLELMNRAISLKADYLPPYIELANFYYNKKDFDSVKKLADRLSKVEFYSPQFIPYIQDLVIIADAQSDHTSKEIFQAIYDKNKALIPPPLGQRK
jgi:O-antigen ligase